MGRESRLTTSDSHFSHEVMMLSVRKLMLVAVCLLTLAGHLAQSEAEDKTAEPSAQLVTRNRVQLNFSGAELIIAAARE